MAPLIILEVYGFIAPALTRQEKRPLLYVAPMSIVLFAGGVTLAYWVAPLAVNWFVDYIRLFGPSAVLNQDPQKWVLFMLKMMGIFGAVFQLPVLLMFLAWIGLLKSAGMKRTWRHAIVGISVVGLVVTPTNDWFTMLAMIIPVIILYIGSIWLVQLIERKRERELRKRFGD
jgi:Sec-independent protein secretion pathway component TatC